MQRGTVYLLHFATSYRHARHYVGYTQDLDQRLSDHSAGRGARLLAVVREAGIPFVLARTWQCVDRQFERRLHHAKNSPKVCPICAGAKAWPFDPTSSRRAKPCC